MVQTIEGKQHIPHMMAAVMLKTTVASMAAEGLLFSECHAEEVGCTVTTAVLCMLSEGGSVRNVCIL